MVFTIEQFNIRTFGHEGLNSSTVVELKNTRERGGPSEHGFGEIKDDLAEHAWQSTEARIMTVIIIDERKLK